MTLDVYSVFRCWRCGGQIEVYGITNKREQTFFCDTCKNRTLHRFFHLRYK
ncbi:MAG: hypothetical protein J5594_05730 [Elusimicrobiaceae bacterium]|nr:hypothetical protein [Elusimicrobiaceae bacterium]